jgi:hypothetical protein
MFEAVHRRSNSLKAFHLQFRLGSFRTHRPRGTGWKLKGTVAAKRPSEANIALTERHVPCCFGAGPRRNSEDGESLVFPMARFVRPRIGMSSFGFRFLDNRFINQAGFPFDLEAGQVKSVLFAGEFFYSFNPIRSPISQAL